MCEYFSEKRLKEDALRDLDMLNTQQKSLKSTIEEIDAQLKSERENSSKYQSQLKDLTEEKDKHMVGVCWRHEAFAARVNQRAF